METKTIPALIWMTEEHEVVVSVPIGLRDKMSESALRRRLAEAIEARYPHCDPVLTERLVLAAASGPLKIFEDAEHGVHFGVTIYREEA